MAARVWLRFPPHRLLLQQPKLTTNPTSWPLQMRNSNHPSTKLNILVNIVKNLYVACSLGIAKLHHVIFRSTKESKLLAILTI